MNLDPILDIRVEGGRHRSTYQGTHTIEGQTQIDGVAAPCRVFLRDEFGVHVDFVRTGLDGLYKFEGLAPGAYVLWIMDDMQAEHRSMIEHVFLVEPTQDGAIGDL